MFLAPVAGNCNQVMSALSLPVVRSSEVGISPGLLHAFMHGSNASSVLSAFPFCLS